MNAFTMPECTCDVNGFILVRPGEWYRCASADTHTQQRTRVATLYVMGGGVLLLAWAILGRIERKEAAPNANCAGA